MRQLTGRFAKRQQQKQKRDALVNGQLTANLLGDLRQRKKSRQISVLSSGGRPVRNAAQDGSTDITKYDYVLGMLMTSGQVSLDDIAILERRFKELDVSKDGSLSEDDLARQSTRVRPQADASTSPSSVALDAGLLSVAVAGVLNVPLFFILDPIAFCLFSSGVLDLLAVVVALGQTRPTFVAVTRISLLALLMCFAEVFVCVAVTVERELDMRTKSPAYNFVANLFHPDRPSFDANKEQLIFLMALEDVMENAPVSASYYLARTLLLIIGLGNAAVHIRFLLRLRCSRVQHDTANSAGPLTDDVQDSPSVTASLAI